MSGSVLWMVEEFGRGGIARYASDVAGMLTEVTTVRVATTNEGPAPGTVVDSEVWFPRTGPAALARPLSAVRGLGAARGRPNHGDVAWVPLGIRPRFERLLVAALRGAGCRIVATVHNRAPHGEGGGAGTVLATARVADAVVVHTAHLDEWARTVGLAVHRLPFPPPDESHAGPAGRHTRATLRLPPNAVIVAMIGNLLPYKGVEELLDALALLPPDSPVYAVLAGQAPDGEALLARARRLSVADRVRLIDGYLPPGELTDVLHLADAAALPYRAIDHSGVGALIAAQRLPAVASDLPGLRELLGESARYVPAGDVRALAAALVALPHDLPALSRAGRVHDPLHVATVFRAFWGELHVLGGA